MAKFDDLLPKGTDGYLTNAKYIQGGYFVVEKYADLSGLRVVDSAYPTVGTIVEGSLCYCQGDDAFYLYNGSDWVAANLGGGGIIDTPETPTKYLLYNLLDDGTYEVSGDKELFDTETYTNVTIPSTHTGKDGVTLPVTQIASRAFDSCSQLETVKIPLGVKKIGEKAFHKCTSLKYIEIPSSVTDLGSNGGAVFEHCSSLSLAIIPSSVQIVGAYTFNGCNLAKIYLGFTTKPSGWADNWNPLKLPEISVPGLMVTKSGTTSYNGNTYSASTGLLLSERSDGNYSVYGVGVCEDVDVVIPSWANGKRVTAIDNGAFKDCTHMRSVIIGDQVTHIGNTAFANCTNLKNVKIPDSVVAIGGFFGEAFLNCKSLYTIVIPDSVETMGQYTFSGCNKLSAILCEAAEVPPAWSPYWNSSDATEHWSYIADTEALAARAAAFENRAKSLENRAKSLEDTVNKLYENEKLIYELLFAISVFEGVGNDVKVWLEEFPDNKAILYGPDAATYNIGKFGGALDDMKDPEDDPSGKSGIYAKHIK